MVQAGAWRGQLESLPWFRYGLMIMRQAQGETGRSCDSMQECRCGWEPLLSFLRCVTSDTVRLGNSGHCPAGHAVNFAWRDHLSQQGSLSGITLTACDCCSVWLGQSPLPLCLPPSFLFILFFLFFWNSSIDWFPWILLLIFKVAIFLELIRESHDSGNISRNSATSRLSFYYLHSVEFPSNDVILQKYNLGETFLNLHIWEEPLP